MNSRTLTIILVIAAAWSPAALGQTVITSDDGSVTVSVTASAKSGDAPKRPGGWLGVRISPVPAPLAAHIASKDAGAMVTNLVKGSPADKAGVKQFDVIVGLDKDAVKDGRHLIKTVGARKPGDKVKLWVMRECEKISIPIALGKPVPANKAKLVHPEPFGPPWNVEKDITRLHPHIMLRKKAGDWEKVQGADLPEQLRKMLESIPRNMPGDPNPNVSVKAKTVIHTKNSDGDDIRIESDETGRITVRRKHKNDAGVETDETKVYENREQLRLTDPEAFDLLKKSNVKVFTSVKPGQPGRRPGGKMPQIKMFTPGEHGKLQKEIREKILKSIEEMDLPDDVKKQIIKQMNRQHDRKGDKDDKDNKQDKKPRIREKVRKPARPKVENTSAAHV